MICLNKNRRLKIPCKRTNIFNKAVKQGKLKRSFKIKKINSEYCVTCFVGFLEKKKENKKLVGIDVGLNNAIAISNGKIFGKELKNLRIRTKHRKYIKKISSTKQGLNHCAHALSKLYPDTDFVVEDLLFKGKGRRSRESRRRNNNWAYNHLANRLKQIGKVEGFNLIKVNPAYSSVTCPVCGFIDKANRQGCRFKCFRCGKEGDADCIAAVNLVERVAKEHSVPLTRGGMISVH